jgi:Tfp pilus assembly protein PilN
MRAVNLLPEDLQQSRMSGPPLAPAIGVAASVLAVGIVGVAAHHQSGAVADRQAHLDALQLQLAHVSAATGQSTDTAAVSLLSTHDQRVAAVNSVLAGRVAYDRVLRQLSLVLPEDVWLDTLTLATGAPADPAAATAPTGGSTITGYTYTATGLARLLQRLDVVPTLKDVSLTSAQIQHRGMKDVYQFTITANVVGAAS